VVNVAVYVVAVAGAVTVWLAAPLSDHEPKTYCVPVVPACVAAASVWLLPEVHAYEQGVVQDAPSTVSASPVGELVTVIAVLPACVSCAPAETNVPGALWLLYSV
jgi:hypothetical protein